MPKIMIFNSFYFPNILGGAEKSVQMLAEALASEGNEVVVVCTSDRDKKDRLNGVKIYYVNIPHLYWGYHSKKKTGLNKFFWHTLDSCNVFSRIKLKKIIQKERPQIIHTNNLTGFSPYVYKIAKKEGIPVIHTLRDYYLLCPRSSMFRENQNCEHQCTICGLFSLPKKKLSQNVDAVVGVSDFILQKHLRNGFFRNAKRKTRIYNIFTSNKAFHKEPRDNKEIRIGYLGILSPTKGIEYTIQSYLKSGVKEASLNIFGRGHTSEYESYLKSKYASEHIKFHGFQNPEDIYPQIDILIIPSLWHEPFPRTLIEAFSYGIPVIAANRGGIPEMIRDRHNGFLFDPDVPDHLTHVLKEVLANTDKLENIQNNALIESTNFKKGEILKQYMEIYESALSQRNA